MAEIFPNTDEVGSVLIQVQDDLKKLRRSLSRITLHEKGEGFNVKALDTAIHRTEIGIRRRAEDYLKTVNKRVLTLPSIEDFEKKKVQISKWKPALESIPDMHPPRGQGVMVSAGEKHKAALTTRLLCNPVHPKNRAVMHQSYGIQLPDLPKRSTASVSTHKIVTGPTVGSLAVVPGGPRCHVYLAPPLSEDDVRAGMAGLVEKGFPLSAAELCLVQTSVHPKAAPLHHRDQSSKTATPERSKCLKALTSGKEMTKAEHEGLPTWNHTPPPSAASKTSNPRHTSQGAAQLTSLNPQCRPSPAPQLVGKLSFAITEGRIDPAAPDFRCFKQHYCLSWSTVVEAVWSLERLLRDFAIPQAQVNGSRLAELARGTGPGWGWGWGGRGGGCSVELLLSVLENREEVWDLVSRPGQRYKGEGGAEAAAVCIQTCWRRHVARAAYLLYHKRKWAAGTIAISWLMHAQLGRVRKALQATRHRHLENFRTRAQHLAANWKLIQSSWRTIIHIPSLGYPHPHRFSLKGFDILQNIQMGRLCDVRDEKVQVIYVSPVNLGEDVRLYYSRLLKLQGGGEGGERFTIITPDALDYFPTHNMCLSTLLKYSPRTLRRIRNLIQGKPAYIVGGVAHVDDLAVADELGVAILGPEPAVAQLYGTKSGGRRVFTSAEVNIAPGQWDIYSLQQLHDSLARLMADNTDVQRWLFKIDAELEGRGTAFCDVSHLSCHAWAQREFQRHRPQRWRNAWAQEVVLIRYLEEVPVWLARHARPVRTSCYPDWAAFLEAFLRQGGVVEAYPPSDSVTCLTVDLLLEPGGDVTMLSCGDQLHGPSMLETAGSSVPQSSVCPDVLHAFCSSVGRACLQRHIVGYVSLDLATFLDPRTLEQKVWAVDLDLTYSNQLAMTQVLLCITGGTLNCRTSCLEVSAPVKKSSSHQKGATQNTTPSLSRRYAVIGSRLLHTNLSMVHYSVFFQMCKAYGIGFDVKEKQGTAFALHDSNERYSLGMITISEDLQGALLTFARNLSVIHQEISAPNMQGETNFKDLIKDVEDVLGVTVQNKSSATQEEDTAVVQS